MPDQDTLRHPEHRHAPGPGSRSGGRWGLLHRGGSRRPRAAVVVLVLALVVGVIGVAVAAWWWRHPTVFDDPEARSTVGMGERRPADEGPIHLAMVRPQDPGSGSAELSSAEPHVLVNTARARSARSASKAST